MFSRIARVAFVFCRNLVETKDLVHQNATEESGEARGGREGRREGAEAAGAIGLPKLLRRKEVAILRCFANWARCNGMKSAGTPAAGGGNPPQQRDGKEKRPVN